MAEKKPAENRDQLLEGQLQRLRRMEEALEVRDEYLFEVKRELRNAEITLRTQLDSLRDAGRAFDTDSAEIVKAKAATLAWTLERATAAVARIIDLAGETATRLARLPDPALGPSRPPVPETD